MPILVLLLIAPAIWANETLSSLNIHGNDLAKPEPTTVTSYLATRAPMPSEFRRYFGLTAGLGCTTLKPKIAQNSVSQTTPNEHVFGFNGGAYGGFGTNLDHFYIGAELSGGYNSSNRTISSQENTKIAITQPAFAGVDLIPGYLTQSKELLFYGRFGMAASLFKFKLNDVPDSVTRQIAIGWRAGLGIEYFMSDSCSVRIEYIFNNYRNIKKNYATTSYELNTPPTQQAMVGLTFNF